MKHKRLLTILAAGAATAVPALADQADFSYNRYGEGTTIVGFNRAEAHDIAIFIKNPALTGAKITGFSVEIPVQYAQADGLSGWLSSELKLENNVNVPDIVSVSPSFRDYVLNVSFPEPYTITDKGVYVGYSFNIKNLNGYGGHPVAVISNNDPNGLFVHTSSFTQWESLVDGLEGGVNSSMTVHLEGAFTEAVGISITKDSYARVGEPGYANVTLSNEGGKPVTSVEYTYTADGRTATKRYDLPEPLPARFGAAADLMLPVDAIGNEGEYPMTVTVTRVNGKENGWSQATAAGKMNVVRFFPTKRPLAEEFTGLWCGWCPRGYVALEELAEEYGEDFVAMAWHNRDDMAITSSYPVSVPGFPYAYIDRATGADAGNLKTNYPVAKRETAIADIDMELHWSGEIGQEAVADATVKFMIPQEGDFRIAYAIVADGLTDPSWRQSNSYWGYRNDYIDQPGYTGEWWDLFLKDSSPYVKGLVFNHVVIASSPNSGEAGSLPGKIEANTPMSHSCTFDISKALNVNGKPIIRGEATLRAIGIVIDANKGKVINCNSSRPIPTAGIGDVAADPAETVETVYYDLAGQRVAEPGKGLYIKVETRSDGSRTSSKEMRR